MNSPNFYIFGVPDGFKMLSGTSTEQVYFQTFYNVYKKGIEFVVNRMPNGRTSYTYLVYDMVSGSSREGAFLGLSLVFDNNNYCNDYERMLELFSGVFNHVVKESYKLVEPCGNGNRFRLTFLSFNDVKDACNDIESIIIREFDKELSNKVLQHKNPISTMNVGRIMYLPLTATNSQIEEISRSYSWVALSSNYIEKPITPQNDSKSNNVQKLPSDELSPDFIASIKNVESLKDFVILGLKGQISQEEILEKRQYLDNIIGTIKNYLYKQPELQEYYEKYISIYEEVCNLEEVLKHENPEEHPTTDEKDVVTRSTDKFLDILKNNRKFLISFFGCLVLVIITAFGLKKCQTTGGGDNPTGQTAETVQQKEPEETFDYNRFKKALENHKFNEAWVLIKDLKKADVKVKHQQELSTEFCIWFNDTYINEIQNKDGLETLKRNVEESHDYNNQYDIQIKRLTESLNDLAKADQLAEEAKKKAEEDKKKAEDAKRKAEEQSVTQQNANVVHIKRLNQTSMDPEGAPITSTTISCKKNDMFVITGTRDVKIEGAGAEYYNGRLKIKTIGPHSVKINNITYNFNASL